MTVRSGSSCAATWGTPSPEPLPGPQLLVNWALDEFVGCKKIAPLLAQQKPKAALFLIQLKFESDPLKPLKQQKKFEGQKGVVSSGNHKKLQET